MVSPSFGFLPASGPTPLAWKEFRRRSGLSAQAKVYTYDASPQIVPNSPTASSLTLSPLLSTPIMGQESPRKDHSGYLVSHVTQALQALGASTGGNIAEYIANNFSTEAGAPYERGRKLHYMVNAILSSPKYKYLFLKDQVLKDEKRSLWRLKQPGETAEDDSANTPSSSSSSSSLNISLASLIPPTTSLSSLIPPASPSLSLATMDTESNPDSISPTNVPSTPTFPTSIDGIKKEDWMKEGREKKEKRGFEERPSSGGSDESRDDKKIHATPPPRITEHASPIPTSTSPLPSSTSPLSSISPTSVSSPVPNSASPLPSPTSADPCSPIAMDTPPADAPMSLSSRRKKRKGSVCAGLDLASSSSSVEMGPAKVPEENAVGDGDKKRRFDVAAA